MIVNSIFLWLLVAFVVATFVESFLDVSRNGHRRIYWFCTACAVVSGFAMAYPDIGKGVGIAALVLVGLALTAYFNTPYIKVHGKIYAEFVDDGRPDPEDATPEQEAPDYDPAPDSYSGVVSAGKFWWGMVPFALLLIGAAVLYLNNREPILYAGLGYAMLVVMAVMAGYGDGTWNYRVARGQYLPLAVVGVLTAGSFVALYLVAYYIGLKRPIRRKQSMEYRAHHRHEHR